MPSHLCLSQEGPGRTATTGLPEKSSLPLRRISPSPMACKSPLTTRGMRSGISASELHQAVVLRKPARLPVRLRLRHRQLSIGPEQVRIPFAPFASTPAWGVRGDAHNMSNFTG